MRDGVTVSDQQQPKYGPAFDPNAGGDGQPDPDAGKDFGYLVPDLQVSWSTPPSFNQDPPDKGGNGEGGGNDVPPCGPFQVHLATLRSAEQRMLGGARTVVGDYKALRSRVMSVKDTVFGQHAMTEGGVVNTGTASQPAMQEIDPEPSPVQDSAKKFASEINPAQEKVLWQIANTVEIVGQYIAAVNRSGQIYGHADRLSVFPDPPGNPT
jgi:hypothetical protein